MKIIAIIPAYNEQQAIAQVVNEVKDKVSSVVVVDDGSADKTATMAQQAGAIVLTHFLNRGQGAALQTGINFALENSADIIVTFDADGQHQADEIEKITKPLLLGQADVVLGSRFLIKNYQIPLLKKMVLKLALWVTWLYTGLTITDVHNGFRAFSKKAAGLIGIKQDGMAHASEILEQIKKYDLRYLEVPVTINYTAYSLQKGQKLSNSFKIFWDLILGKISK